jgi:hypothetical protein
VPFQGGLRRVLAREAFPVGGRDLGLGHVGGVVPVPEGRVERRLVLLLPAVVEVRCGLTGGDVDGQDILSAAVGRRQLEVADPAHGGLQVDTQPLAELLVVDGGEVDADHVDGVADAVDEQPTTSVGHRGDVLGELVQQQLLLHIDQRGVQLCGCLFHAGRAEDCTRSRSG